MIPGCLYAIGELGQDSRRAGADHQHRRKSDASGDRGAAKGKEAGAVGSLGSNRSGAQYGNVGGGSGSGPLPSEPIAFRAFGFLISAHELHPDSRDPNDIALLRYSPQGLSALSLPSRPPGTTYTLWTLHVGTRIYMVSNRPRL